MGVFVFMVAKSYDMGHEIIYLGDRWCYADNEQDTYHQRPCKKCGLFKTPEGHDPCIANLDGVRNACCGHGVTEGYVQFDNGLVIRGYFDHLKDKQGEFNG
jgi:hypothetical protein